MKFDIKIRCKEKTYFFKGPERATPDHPWCYSYGFIKPSHYHTIHARVNKFPQWLHRIKYRLLQLKMFLKREQYKMCRGCGEGLAAWRIVDPNYLNSTKRKRYYNCCEYCVNFYGWSCKPKEITGWKNNKAVCGKND